MHQHTTPDRRVLHVVSALDQGGAETMLFRLLAGLEPANHLVVSLRRLGYFGPRLRRRGVEVHALDMGSWLGAPGKLLELVRIIRSWRPACVQTWLYHADLVGGLAARIAGVPRIVWGIHHWNLAPEANKRARLAVIKVLARLSSIVPHRIVSCAASAIEAHVALGYRQEKFLVIPNGIDTTLFRPDAEDRGAIRAELGLSAEDIVIGTVGRFEFQKDHRNLLRAAGHLRHICPPARFLLVGADLDNERIRGWIAEADLASSVHLLGPRQDVPRILRALDLFVLSSLGEAFPLALLEALATGVPCVTTRVGDAAQMVGGIWEVVEPRDPIALMTAMRRVLDMPQEERDHRCQAARAHVERSYAIESVRRRYLDVWGYSSAGESPETAPPSAGAAAETTHAT